MGGNHKVSPRRRVPSSRVENPRKATGAASERSVCLCGRVAPLVLLSCRRPLRRYIQTSQRILVEHRPSSSSCLVNITIMEPNLAMHIVEECKYCPTILRT